MEAKEKGKKNAKVEPKAKAKGKVHCQGPKAKTKGRDQRQRWSQRQRQWVGECLEIHSGSKAGDDFQQKGADPSMQNHFRVLV